MAKNIQNLVSISERSTDEAREISRKGGIKSGESRRRKRTTHTPPNPVVCTLAEYVKEIR